MTTQLNNILKSKTNTNNIINIITKIITHKKSNSPDILFYLFNKAKLNIIKILLEDKDETITTYIKENINKQNENGETCLIIINKEYLITKELLIIEKLLINKGLDVNITDNNGNTALIYAIQNYNKYIYRNNHNINRNYINRNNIEYISILINENTDLNKYNKNGETPLIYAIQNNINNIIEFLINNGADVNKGDNDGKTPLIYAIQNNINNNIIKFLINNGADVNIIDKENGMTLLHYCISISISDSYYTIKKNNYNRNNYNNLILLINTVKDVNIKDKNNMTLLVYFILNYKDNTHKIELFNLLISKGANINSNDKNNRKLLFDCIQNNINNDIIVFLISKEKNINISDQNGKTLLIYSIEKDNMTIFNLLIEKGADVNKGDNNGKTPLIYSIKINRKFISSLLIEKGADVNKGDNDGKTPLIYSIEHNNISIFNELIDNRADINIGDKDKKIPIFYAIDTIYRQNNFHRQKNYYRKNDYYINSIYEKLLEKNDTYKMNIKVLIYQINTYINQTYNKKITNSPYTDNYEDICISNIKNLLKKYNLYNYTDDENNTFLTYIIKNYYNKKTIDQYKLKLNKLIKILIDENKGVDLFVKDKNDKTFLIYLFSLDEDKSHYHDEDFNSIISYIKKEVLPSKEKTILDNMILFNNCTNNCQLNGINNLKYLYIKIYKRFFYQINNNFDNINNKTNNNLDIGLEYIYINDDEEKYTQSFFIKIQSILNNNNKEQLKESFISRLQKIKKKIPSRPILKKIGESVGLRFKTTSSNNKKKHTNYDELIKTDINLIILEYLFLSKECGYPIYYDDNEFKNIFFNDVIDYFYKNKIIPYYENSENVKLCRNIYKKLLINISNIKNDTINTKNTKIEKIIKKVGDNIFPNSYYTNYLNFYLSHFVKDT